MLKIIFYEILVLRNIARYKVSVLAIRFKSMLIQYRVVRYSYLCHCKNWVNYGSGNKVITV